MSERLRFECITAIDKRRVRLTADRYENHVLEHEDLLRDFDNPSAWIQMALETAETIEPGEWGEMQVYIGPPVTPPKGIRTLRCFEVVVWREPDNCGHVVTAMAPTVKKRAGGRR